MPQVRKLAPEEVQTIENKGKGTRKLVEEQYDSILADYEVGDYGEAVLDEGENRLTVRNRLVLRAGWKGRALLIFIIHEAFRDKVGHPVYRDRLSITDPRLCIWCGKVKFEFALL